MTESAREYSDATARRIDREVKDIIDARYERALSALSKNRDILENGAHILLSREKIEGEELKKMMDRVIPLEAETGQSHESIS